MELGIRVRFPAVAPSLMRKVEQKYIWTSHVQYKMKHYKMSETLVKRIIRHPDRVEEAIVPDLVAAMKEMKSKRFPEAWVMYTPVKGAKEKLKIITAWRYPAESSARDPIPEDIIKEVRDIIGF